MLEAADHGFPEGVRFLVERKKVKHLRVVVHADLRVRLVVPPDVTEACARAFLESRRDWIDRTLARYMGRPGPGEERDRELGLWGSSLLPEGVQFSVERKRVKNLRVIVYRDLRVRLVLPPDVTEARARAFLESRKDWMARTLAGYMACPRPEYVSGEEIPLWGRKHVLVVRDGSPSGVRLENDRVVMTVFPLHGRSYREALLHSWYADLLMQELGPLIGKWAQYLGVCVRRYGVRRMRTRWGSCTPARGSIRFNTLLAARPRHLLEYIVVHELCHLLEPSHNARFHALVASCYPHWRSAERELREKN